MPECTKREYRKLQDVFASIGGIIKMIVLLAQFINYIPSIFYSNLEIFNDVLKNNIYFNIEENEENRKINKIPLNIFKRNINENQSNTSLKLNNSNFPIIHSSRNFKKI